MKKIKKMHFFKYFIKNRDFAGGGEASAGRHVAMPTCQLIFQWRISKNMAKFFERAQN